MIASSALRPLLLLAPVLVGDGAIARRSGAIGQSSAGTAMSRNETSQADHLLRADSACRAKAGRGRDGGSGSAPVPASKAMRLSQPDRPVHMTFATPGAPAAPFTPRSRGAAFYLMGRSGRPGSARAWPRAGSDRACILHSAIAARGAGA